MNRGRRWTWIWITAVVAAHLAISIVHGAVHAKAGVRLSPVATAFVIAVIAAGPLIGLGLMRAARRLGALVIAVTMAGSLVFGLVNHFVIAGPDHVAHIDRQWRPLFTTTAVLLVLTETLGSGLALTLLQGRRTR